MNQGFRLTPDRASDYAGQVDHVLLFLLLVSLFFTVLIATLIIYFAIKYRRRPTGQPGTNTPAELAMGQSGPQGATPPPPLNLGPPPPAPADHTREGILLEITWTGVPMVLLVVMSAWGGRGYICQGQPP